MLLVKRKEGVGFVDGKGRHLVKRSVSTVLSSIGVNFATSVSSTFLLLIGEYSDDKVNCRV